MMGRPVSIRTDVVRAGGPTGLAIPPEAIQAIGLPPGTAQALAGLTFENGKLIIPAAKLQELVRKFAGDKAKVTPEEGRLAIQIDDSARINTAITPSLSNDGGLLLTFDKTKWQWFIFGGKLSPGDTRDRFLKEIDKKRQKAEPDDDDIESYNRHKANVVKFEAMLDRLEALPGARTERNADKIDDIRENLEDERRKLGERRYAKVRAKLDPKPPTMGEKLLESLQPEGEAAVRLDLPLPAGIKVRDLHLSPKGLEVTIDMGAPAPQPMFAAKDAPMSVAGLTQAPMAPKASPLPVVAGCQAMGDLRTAFAAVEAVAAQRYVVPAPAPIAAQPTAAGPDATGITDMIAKLPTGSGKAMGFVPVTITRDGTGLRVESPVGQIQITQISGRWQAIRNNQPAAFIERAVPNLDAAGNVTYTLQLASGTQKVPQKPVTFVVKDGGRTLTYQNYSVTMDQAAA